MNNFNRWTLFLIGGIVVILLLVGTLTVFPALAQGPGGMMGGGGYGHHGMMGGFGYNNNPQSGGYGPGGMMGYAPGHMGTMPCGYGHHEMMGGSGYGPMGGGMMGHGMMWNNNSPFFATKPLTTAEVTEAVNAYLASLNDTNLKLGEVMIFDNHAYAQIVEKESGTGAMEVLVDLQSKAVYPEMGPNMMWNLKYGMTSNFGGYGMMGGRFGFNGMSGQPAASAEMPVSPEQAVEAAQVFLNAMGSNLEADEHTDPFYGYYTLHVNRDGETIGMLSVNGYSGQVFLHTWHGNLLEASHE
ncbi:hypothetical protein ACFLXQ_00145 [Chloroflexota bacterium]